MLFKVHICAVRSALGIRMFVEVVLVTLKCIIERHAQIALWCFQPLCLNLLFVGSLARGILALHLFNFLRGIQAPQNVYLRSRVPVIPRLNFWLLRRSWFCFVLSHFTPSHLAKARRLSNCCFPISFFSDLCHLRLSVVRLFLSRSRAMSAIPQDHGVPDKPDFGLLGRITAMPPPPSPRFHPISPNLTQCHPS